MSLDQLRDVRNIESKESDINGKLKFKYFNFDITYSERNGDIVLKGSIHKYWNYINGRGYQNYNDFNMMQAYHAFIHLSSNFGVGLKDMTPENRETAVNLRVSISPTEIIKDNIVCNRQSLKKDTLENFENGVLGQLRAMWKSTYRIKMYDKGKESGISGFIFRFEVHEDRTSRINTINYVHDLFVRHNVDKITKHLLEQLNDCLIVDTFNPDNITDEKDAKLLLQYTNSKFWSKLRDGERKTYGRTWNKAHKLFEKYGLLKIRKELTSKAIQKIKELTKELPSVDQLNKDSDSKMSRSTRILDIDSSTENKVCNHSNFTPPISHKKCIKMSSVLEPVQLQKEPNNRSSCRPFKYKGLRVEMSRYKHSIVVDRDICLSSTLDITHQKRGSKFISEKTVNGLRISNPNEHKRLVKKYLPNGVKNLSNDTIDYRIAHNARNEFHNPRTRKRKKIQRLRESNLLFPIQEVVSNPEYRKII
ncbi:hypothetical protein [Membranihabitans marinus]|uniref:hypothetical protein n=1 Tax=Membranihabitans marinus TaxID=1227546 RepID=UPI001F1E343A|nr:hypothetical protein [Membranihabitans marinus]